MIAELFGELAIRFALVATRMAGFTLVSPFPGEQAPTKTRVGFVLLLAMVATPSAPRAPLTTLDLQLVAPGASEIATGLVLGFVLRVAMAASEMLGSSIAQALGLTFASIFDPAVNENKDPLSRLVSLAAMTITLAVGAHRVALSYLLHSFQVLPPGVASAPLESAPVVLAWLARSVEVGVRLALPCVAVAMTLGITLALIARTAPSLQVFNVGIAITVASGLVVLITGWGEIVSGFGEHLGGLGRTLDSALAALVPKP